VLNVGKFWEWLRFSLVRIIPATPSPIHSLLSTSKTENIWETYGKHMEKWWIMANEYDLTSKHGDFMWRLWIRERYVGANKSHVTMVFVGDIELVNGIRSHS
jgi:hypothetical protein